MIIKKMEVTVDKLYFEDKILYITQTETRYICNLNNVMTENHQWQ